MAEQIHSASADLTGEKRKLPAASEPSPAPVAVELAEERQLVGSVEPELGRERKRALANDARFGDGELANGAVGAQHLLGLDLLERVAALHEEVVVERDEHAHAARLLVGQLDERARLVGVLHEAARQLKDELLGAGVVAGDAELGLGVAGGCGDECVEVHEAALGENLVILGHAEGGGARVVALEALLRDAKVGEADVALAGEQNVLGLEVAIQNGGAVQVLEAEADLGGVEAHALLVELLLLLEVEEELATIDVVHDEVELLARLERVVEVDEERVDELLENVLLGLGVLHLVALDNGLLVEHLHGVDLASVLLGDLDHFAERALANHLEQVKVVEADLVLLLVKVDAGLLLLHGVLERLHPLGLLRLRLGEQIEHALHAGRPDFKAILLAFAIRVDHFGIAFQFHNAELARRLVLRVVDRALAQHHPALAPRLKVTTLLCKKSLLVCHGEARELDCTRNNKNEHEKKMQKKKKKKKKKISFKRGWCRIETIVHKTETSKSIESMQTIPTNAAKSRIGNSPFRREESERERNEKENGWETVRKSIFFSFCFGKGKNLYDFRF
jgi:hypothetical protein